MLRVRLGLLMQHPARHLRGCNAKHQGLVRRSLVVENATSTQTRAGVAEMPKRSFPRAKPRPEAESGAMNPRLVENETTIEKAVEDVVKRRVREKQIEDIVKLQKEGKLKAKAVTQNMAAKTKSTAAPTKKPTFMSRAWEGVKHGIAEVANGFKLLYRNTKVSVRLLGRVASGKRMTRRENKQLIRTAADLFRLIPLLPFVLIPFAEIALPFFLMLFPNMLPSTFSGLQSDDSKKRLKKQNTQARIEMARFLQNTVEEMALVAKSQRRPDQTTMVEDFNNFFKKVRENKESVSSKEIMRFSKLFENQLTLDNLSRPQIVAMMRLMELPAFGTTGLLRFQLRMKLRELRADDITIRKEGIAQLSNTELQQACQARGMKALGLTRIALEDSLEGWISLHLDSDIPSSLLVLSRAVAYGSDPESALKKTFEQLPDAVVDEEIIRIAYADGQGLCNADRLKVLEQQEQLIQAEQVEEADHEKVAANRAALVTDMDLDPSGTSTSKVTVTDIETVANLIGSIQKESQEREDLEDIKEDRDEYNEEMAKLKSSGASDFLAESTTSSQLGKTVDRLLSEIDSSLSDEPRSNIDGTPAQHVSVEQVILRARAEDLTIHEDSLRTVLMHLDDDGDGILDKEEIDQIKELMHEDAVSFKQLEAGTLRKLARLADKEQTMKE